MQVTPCIGCRGTGCWIYVGVALLAAEAGRRLLLAAQPGPTSGLDHYLAQLVFQKRVFVIK